ncbi:MAG TPA: Ig domain-containing protein, partial [Thermoanaerobaculia bacterium]|nr:Ig domain-containing protein [Thermoanaerobaculia bacterium]
MRELGRAYVSFFGKKLLVAAAAACALGAGPAFSASPASTYFSVTPCRIFDTRLPAGPLGGPPMGPGELRLFTIAGNCGVPLTASAVSASLIVTDANASGLLRVFPSDVAEPTTNTISFSAGQTRAGNGLLLLATDGSGALAFHNLSLGAINVVFDVTGFFDTACAPITVDPPSLASVPDGTPVNATLTASGGNGPYSFAVTSGALPGNVNLSPAGVLSGTATAGGSFNFTVTATDFNGCTGSRAYTLLIVCPTITVTPTTIPPGSVGVPYGPVTFTQTGAVGAVTWSFTGTLPTGVGLDAAGILSGTPTQAGTFPITVKATDAGGCFGTVDVVLSTCPTITVNPTNGTLPVGTQGSPYSQTFTASGGSGTYTFAITAGTLPAPMNLSSGGVLSGTPAVAGDFGFTVTATDTVTNCKGSRAYTLHLA